MVAVAAQGSAGPDKNKKWARVVSDDEFDFRLSAKYLTAAALAGGLVAGTFNLTFACAVYGVSGISPLTIMQSVASGVFGKSAYDGGVGMAVTGLMLHFALSIVMSGVFVAIASRVLGLVKHPVFWGALYGIFLFFLMHYVVVPLSAHEAAVLPPWPIYKAGLIVHAFLVGVPMAVAARHFICVARHEAAGEDPAEAPCSII